MAKRPFTWRGFLWRWTKRLFLLVVLAFCVCTWWIFPRYITQIDALNSFFRRRPGRRIPQELPEHTCTSTDGQTLAYDTWEPRGDSATTTVILLHGIRSHRYQHADLARDFLLPAGFRAVLMDHRSHGHSTGDWCTFGVKEGQDVSRVIDDLEARGDGTDHYVVWGYSLGGSVAAQALAGDPRIDAGIIESTFASYNEVVHNYMDRFAVDLGWYGDLLAWRAASMADFQVDDAVTEEVFKRVRQPVFMAHGTEDRSIPYNHGRRNFDAIPHTNKQWFTLEGYGHRGVVRSRPAEYEGLLLDFLNKLGN